MKLRYKVEIHKRKGHKNDTRFITFWKNKKSDKYGTRQIDFCCDQMKKLYDNGFMSIESDKQHYIGIKYDERKEKLKEPTICLQSYSEDGFGNDGCPHEEIVFPINACPFCNATIESVRLEKKRITHICKKVKKTYEECEDITKEEII